MQKKQLKNDSIRYKRVSHINHIVENAIEEFKRNIIKPVDKSKLKSAISQAKQLYNNSTEGSQTGQYKSGSKSTLMNAINKAEEVYNNSSAKQDEIDSPTSSLSSSISTFKNSKVTQSDKNQDGSYTREYVDAYVKRLNYPYFRMGVLDASEDKILDGELCYRVVGSSIETDESGFAQPIEYYIGSKTLKIYPYGAVGW